MEIHSEQDFPALRQHLKKMATMHSMFKHDVRKIENIVEEHITRYSQHLVRYRQTKSRACLEKAQKEIDDINRVLATVGKVELMAILSKR
jgi:hypothetical protein